MNPLQQGLKLQNIQRQLFFSRVAIMNPLQQGLKQDNGSKTTKTNLGCNNESTTTRIETWCGYLLYWHNFGCNNESTTTRIETTFFIRYLSPPPPRCNNESTTTRIETHSLRILIIRMQVAIMNPLQQGLKPPTTFVNVSSLMVAIMNPLQQGLKHKMLLNTLYGKFGLQ